MPTFVLTGAVAEEKHPPVAVLQTDREFTVLGAVVLLDATPSRDPDGFDLTYTFSFLSVPIGSKVALEGFRELTESGASVSFSPDLTGRYLIGLVVSNGVFESEIVTKTIDVQPVLVPHAKGMVPDGKFIWSYLRDVWTEVEGREFFETLWSALVQISGAELLKLYQIDFNKSIADIQDLYQRRWLSYEPNLDIIADDVTFYIGNEAVGQAASTGLAGDSSQDALTDTITIPLEEGAELESLVPGRIIIVNGRAWTITRISKDETQRIPVAVLIVESATVSPGLNSLPWSVPHTLVSKSQNFEELGVAAGDTLVVTIFDSGSLAVEVALQVVGVDGSRLGFIMTDAAQVPGELPSVSSSSVLAVADRFSISSVTRFADGSLGFQGEASSLWKEAHSILFQRAYWNRELTSETVFTVGKRTFTVSPKRIVRNSRVPVSDEVRSIPALQEYVKQPAIEVMDGQLYKKHEDHLIPISREPVVLTERYHFLVDAGTAFEGELTFRTGSNIIDADAGDFADLGLRTGDSFIIDLPLTLAGSYEISQVLSRNKLKLVRQVPLYPLSDYVTAKVRLERASSNRYLRFIPGLFTAKNPAPDRLWAEVSFFDNDPNIERNFGILVGLTKDDIESVSGNATYRQAVAGLMYAFVNGPAVDKIRLGASLLLGLPFTERRGIIRSIENDYRRDSAGNPVTGRILVEDVSDTDVPTGVMRIYTFPIDEFSELAGVDTNPATGKAYVVGDLVEAYASLAKGVEIRDFMSSASGLTSLQLLQRYHSTRVRINDNIFQPEEVRLVSSFLRKITPSYVSIVITNSSEYRDVVAVNDKVKMKISVAPGSPPFIDDVGNTFPIPLAYDTKLYSGISWSWWDSAPAEVRYAGKDIAVDATDRTRLNVPSGGLLTPGALHLFEAPLCRVGDKLALIGGIDDGLYTISALTNSTLQVSDGPPVWSFTGKLAFAVLRPATHLIRSGVISAKDDDDFTDPDTTKTYEFTRLTVETGLRTDGVAPGDWLLASDGSTTTRHTVIGLAGPTSPFPRDPALQQALPFTQIVVTPLVPAGASSYRVYRPSAFVSSVADFNVTSDGSNSIEVDDPYVMALAEPGDEIQLLATGLPRLTVLDPFNLWVSPSPPNGTFQAKLLKSELGGQALVTDGVMGRLISDKTAISLQNIASVPRLDLGAPTPGPDGSISGDTVTWGAYGAFDPAAAGFRPGDFFRPLSEISNNKTRDLGYGPGLYPIVEVSDTTVKLSVALSNGRSQWAVTRRS